MDRTYTETVISEIEADLEGTVGENRMGLLRRMQERRQGHVADHAKGVASHSAALAAEIGFSHEAVALLKDAATWHDVGKLGTPDTILCKPAKLAPDEVPIMQRHAADGARLLGPSASRMMLDVAAYHHERYDGHGYAGLRGEEIPLAARIVQVADCHDALIKERHYKKGMPEEAALLLMTADTDSPSFGRRGFDPYLLRTFVSLRLRDPDLNLSPEARSELAVYAASDPMSDLEGGWEANGGWTVKASGHRMRYERAENGNRRLAEMRGPDGRLVATRNSREIAFGEDRSPFPAFAP